MALQRHQSELSEEQRHRLLPLGQDLRGVWQHPAAPEALQKRIVRTILQEIIIDTISEPPEHLLPLHGHGGVHTALRGPRNTAGKPGRATPPDVLGVIRERSQVCRDLTLAAPLNRLGYRTGTGNPWRAHRVACVRYQYRLPNVPTGQDWLTRTQAAQQLGVSATVVTRLIAQGLLPASQVVPQAPWIIKRTDLDLAAVQVAVEAVRASRPCRRLLPRPPEMPCDAAHQADDGELPSSAPPTLLPDLKSGGQ